MSSYTSGPSCRPPRTKRSTGGTVLNLLMFLGASVLILGVVIAYEKSARQAKPSPAEEEAALAAQTESYSEDYYRNRGEAYYTERGLRPNTESRTSPREDVRHPAVTPPVITPEIKPVHPAPAPQYVGDPSYKYYHRLDCKYAQLIPEDKKVFFASPDDAWSKGYIPCKICRPPVPAGDDTSHAARAEAKPKGPSQRLRKSTEKPISLPVKDVDVSFPFRVVEREVLPEKGVVRVELTVEVDAPLVRENILRLAQKLVAAEIIKQNVNSVSIFMRSKVTGRTMLKWVCMVDWAPYGNLTRATEVAAGDYHTHEFSIFDQGFFKP